MRPLPARRLIVVALLLRDAAAEPVSQPFPPPGKWPQTPCWQRHRNRAYSSSHWSDGSRSCSIKRLP